jgi:phosphoglycolate phosphatase-like HAD superfamily hydrolase
MNSRFSGIVEFSSGFQARPELSHVVFDFDGTLSLIRQGWPDVMLPMFVELLPPSPGSSAEADRQMLYDDMMELTGKQTIYQMIRFAERIRERGGEPLDPLEYKHEYLRRLDQRIHDRHERLTSGKASPEEFLVHNSLELLQVLKDRGMNLYLASGTDEPFVRREAAMLGIDSFFGEHIYGAQDDYRSFSKKMVIERILRENGIQGANLLSFGDGYVEIENTKDVGGLAVAVASDEDNNGSGRMDPWKKERLARVNADVFIPDYRDIRLLMDVLTGASPIPS